MGIRVIVADGASIVRQGVVALLSEEAGIDIVAEAESGLDAVSRAAELAPDLLLLDVGVSDQDDIETLRRISVCVPRTGVVVMAEYADPRFVENALQAGARGFLLQRCTVEELIKAVKTVAAGGIYFGGQVDDDAAERPGQGSRRDGSLTGREQEVMKYLVDGKSSREIARLLGLSVKTVECHRKQILKKLHLTNVAELTRYAIREGVIPL